MGLFALNGGYKFKKILSFEKVELLGVINGAIRPKLILKKPCPIKKKTYICTRLGLSEIKRINNQGSGTLQINVICQLELDYRDTEKKENLSIG